MDKKAFLVYKDIDIEGLTKLQLGDLFKAMIDHANEREVEIDDPEVKGMWREIKKKMDSADEEYKKKCATNKRIAQEREARKKKNTNVNERERTYTNVENEHLTDNREQITDNREQITDNGEQIPPKGGNKAHTRPSTHLDYDTDVLMQEFDSPELAATFGEWIDCRMDARMGPYPPAAMADDLSKARTYEKKYGAQAVMDVLKASFTYKRPVWDRLEKSNPAARSGTQHENGTDYLLRRIEEEEAKEALND